MLIPRIGDDVIQKIIKCDLFNLHPMYKGGYKSYLRAFQNFIDIRICCSKV